MKEIPVLEFIEQIEAGNELSPACVRWLRFGVHGYVFNGKPLEQALGLTQVGGKGARSAYRHRRMVHHLQNAADTIRAPTDWSRAKLLSREVAAFARSKWPRWERGGVPPCASDLDRELFGAFQASRGKVPSSATRLYSLLFTDASPAVSSSEAEHRENMSLESGGISHANRPSEITQA